MQESINILKERLGREWGWLVLRGIVCIIFGLMAISWPLATIWALAVMWGIFAILEGGSAIMVGWRLHRSDVRWWPYAIFGGIGVLAGIIALVWPGISAFVLIYVIGFWALFGGVSQISAAITLRKAIANEWLLILSGVISVIFGLLILFRPLPEGAMAISWVVGFFAIIVGILSLMLAFTVRKKS